MANFGPSLWFVRDNAPTSTIGWSAVTAWAATTAKTAGQLVRQLAAPTVGNERVFACIIAGTTLASEPTWVVTKGAKTAEAAGPTWIEVTGQPGVNGNTTDSPAWLQNKNTAVTQGLIIYDSVSAALQIVTTLGTTGNGSAPSFSATAGTTTADNTVTWTSLGLASGFGAWAAPFARMQSAAATNWMTVGNSLFLGDDHSETQSSAMTVTFPGAVATPNPVYSIDHTGAATLSGATLKTGAAITTTGNSAMTITGAGFSLNGLTLLAGSGANSVTLALANTAQAWARLDGCAVRLGGTSGGAVTCSTNNGTLIWNNTTLQVASASASLTPPAAGRFIWRNTASAITGATFPSNVVNGGVTDTAIILDGVDFSALPNTSKILSAGNVAAQLTMVRCNISSGLVVTSTPLEPAHWVDVINVDSAGTNYLFQQYRYQGTQTPETVMVRTGGATNGTTALSSKSVTTANSMWLMPLQSFPISIWNTVTGTNRVVTLYGIWSAAALPNNDDVWIEAEYFGSASSPQASFANNTKANNLATGSALTADSTSAWDSLVTARANTTVYTTASIIKLASNPGRVFFCTTGGTSAGSEPGGYASAVDGGSVTDGTAVFRAGVRFSMAVTLNSPQPAMAGPIMVTVNAAKVSSTFYVDPLINLS